MALADFLLSKATLHMALVYISFFLAHHLPKIMHFLPKLAYHTIYIYLEKTRTASLASAYQAFQSPDLAWLLKLRQLSL